MKCDLPRLTRAQARELRGAMESRSFGSPRLSSEQANALRLSARGGLRLSARDGLRWVWGDAGVGVQVIRDATVDAMVRHDCVWVSRSLTMHPSDTGRAWLAANPDGKA